jgi:hypothetical protein
VSNSSLERAGELFDKVQNTKPMSWIEATQAMQHGHTVRRRAWHSIVVGVRHPSETESKVFRGKRKSTSRFFALVCTLRAGQEIPDTLVVDSARNEVVKTWTPYIEDFDATDWEVLS